MGLFDDLKDVVLGIGSAVTDVAAGPGMPGAPADMGRAEALQQAGLAMLASDNQNTLQAFAQAAQQSQQYRMQYQKMQMDHARQQQFAQLVSEVGYDREGISQLYFQALADGDIPMAKTLSEVLKAMPGAAAPTKLDKTKVTVVDDDGTAWEEIVWSDPFEGREVSRSRVGKAKTTQMLTDEFWQDDPNDPTREIRMGYTPSGALVEVGSRAKPGRAGGGRNIERDLSRAVIPDVDRMFDPAARLDETGVAFLARVSGSDSWIGDLANSALSPETQSAVQAQASVLSALVRIMSGAQMTENEYSRYRNAYAIRANEDPSVSARKKETVLRMLNNFAVEQVGVDDQGNPIYQTYDQNGNRVTADQVRAIVRTGIDSELAPVPETGGGTFDDIPNVRDPNG